MKTVLALLLTVLMAPSVQAAWTQVDADSLRTTFADAATVTRAGALARMASLVDFSRFQRMVEVGYFSQRFVHEYDCAQRRARRLNQTFHAGHMGEGAAIYADEAAQDWSDITEGSSTERLLKIACRDQ